ncbi:MAG: glycoside hydrolase family 57 protein [Candidatus Kapaibacterium sp.]
MLPLRIAFLWHQHQPYYKMNGEFVLPWVRLHGVKDYYDLPEVLYEFPEIKQTFNMVPSLMAQIDEYISGETSDKIQALTLKRASELNENDKREILRLFFLCNVDNMIRPYPRYIELFDKAQNVESALSTFDENDWLDLQVWYNLTWIGPFSRQQSLIKRLFTKGKYFTEQEKELLMDIHGDILSSIIPQLKKLISLDQIEVCCSPFHHPILPLLVNSEAARESIPMLELPNPVFSAPDDADAQIKMAKDFYKQKFGSDPDGMWPSEGSISIDVLKIISRNKFKWTASDEHVLKNSAGKGLKEVDKYFPRKFKYRTSEINLLFRDQFLSDRIGFTYSNWDSFDAANDFTHHLRNIRNSIIDAYGDEALKHAVVPVILDGENCWEFYHDNGVPFLRELYKQITNAKEFETVTCSEAASDEHASYMKPLHKIVAGSWINANFSIWIGHEDDRKAWAMLSKARTALEQKRQKLSEDKLHKALDEVYISEASDWWWWYGPEHNAENKKEFDIMFRWHVEQIYKNAGLDVPEEVYMEITEQKNIQELQYPEDEISPEIDGVLSGKDSWNKAGFYNAKGSMGSMHQIGELLDKFLFGRDENNIYFRLDLIKTLDSDDFIELEITDPVEFKVIFKKNGFNINNIGSLEIDSYKYAYEEIIEFAISADVFDRYTDKPEINVFLRTYSAGNEILYPRQGKLKLKFSQ